MTDLIKFLRTSTSSAYNKVAADRIEELERERDDLGRKLNTARYGQPDFAWAIHEEAMADLRAKLAKAVEAGVDVAASLNAATSLLERGGKRAAASDKMFDQMLMDYNASLDRFRATLAEIKGGNDAESNL